MNSYGLYVLIATMAAMSILAIVPTYASTISQEACPGCSDNTSQMNAKMAKSGVPISVWTDNTVYDHTSEIQVSGAVANRRGDAQVTVTVFNPQNNLVTVRQVEVADDNTFGTSISTSGELFKQNGIYTIRVQYGPQEINDKVKVELTGETIMKGETACASGELSAKAGSKVYCIPYTITGGTVTKATINSETTSLVLMIDAKSDGSISLVIPRNVLDSQTNGKDSNFVVLVDGEEVNYEQIASDNTKRTLDITFAEGATEIEVIGTFAVPEFGTMAAIILAVAIVSIIAVSARSRLSILSRY
jgi:predicted secreted protein with PEFG-CTERM motif